MEERVPLPAEESLAEAAPRRPWSGLLRSVVLPLGILAVILGGLWYWQWRGDSSASDDYGVVELPAALNATGREPAVEVGRAAPDFILERPQGGTLRLSDLQGRPVLLNFWASWCAPCRQEMPELVAAYERYSASGLEIVAVNLQESDKTALDFAAEFGITFPIVVDVDGELSGVWRLGGPIEGIPTSYFIDASGVIQALRYGPLTGEMLDERVALIAPEEAG
ncbi:MAG: TlpA disulfide reductase family protein [Dehalococcoidia bacterium]